MYFLPRNKADVVLNQGIVSDQLFGDIKIRFPVEYNIKGLTIDFGRAFPVDFKIESDNNVVEVTGNTDGHYVSDAVFLGATYLRFVPVKMAGGQSRFRIHQLTIGLGLNFDSRRILSATKKEYISPIMEELPTVDFDLTVNNKDRSFDIENEMSSVNFLEIGQEVRVLYGQEIPDGTVEWLPGATLQLRQWSADDEEMSFSATVGMFVALDYVWDKTKEDRTVEKAIFIDETWQLIGASSNRLAAEFVLEIFKIIRGYAGAAICATQDLNDFFALDDGKYGKGIINNSKTKIVLNLEDEEAQRVQDILHLSEAETMAITHFERGNALISTNNNNVTVEFKASQLEKELITTDREELKKLIARQRQQSQEPEPVTA